MRKVYQAEGNNEKIGDIILISIGEFRQKSIKRRYCII